jgi:hypothetical protein
MMNENMWMHIQEKRYNYFGTHLDGKEIYMFTYKNSIFGQGKIFLLQV